MSGHSKWSTIKRAKGAADARRSNIFTKLGRAISIAVKEGGGITDPSMNFKLRLAVDKAKAANMPKSTIQRAIDNGAGKSGGNQIETIIYEGYAPDGIAVMVETVTDNKQRTVSDVRNIFNRSGGTLGQSGSVSFMFHQVGQIEIDPQNGDIDELTLQIMEVEGVLDIETAPDLITIYTEAKLLMHIKESLQDIAPVKSTELIMKPTDPTVLEESKVEQLLNFIDKLEDNDDIQRVFVSAIVE